jgi:ribosomal protein L32
VHTSFHRRARISDDSKANYTVVKSNPNRGSQIVAHTINRACMDSLRLHVFYYERELKRGSQSLKAQVLGFRGTSSIVKHHL